MKKILISLVVFLKTNLLDLAYFVEKINNFRGKAKKHDSILILPGADGWEGKGEYSFGDEMLMLGLYEGLKSKFGRNICAISMNGHGQREVLMHGHPIKIIGFNKGWLSLSSYREFGKILNDFSHFIVMGADVMDGAYSTINSTQRLRFLNIAAKKGLKTAITGFSFNGTEDKKIRKLFIDVEQSGSIIYARENTSQNRLSEFLKNPILVADLAFKVDPARYDESKIISNIKKMAEIWKRDNGVVIGINLCGWHIKDKDCFFSLFVDALLEAKKEIGNMALLLIPHDTREEVGSDLSTLEELNRRIDGKIKVIGFPSDIRSGIDAKQVISCCDVLLTGRMHLAIAAHDQGVPAVSFAYQGKFEGFYDLYKMNSDWMVKYENPANAVNKLISVLINKNEISEKIIHFRLGIRLAADGNFKFI